MILTSGAYVVTSLMGERVIGRSPIETQDMRPKQVFALPESEGPHAPPVRLILLTQLNRHFTC